MNMSASNVAQVEVQLELGHRAEPRTKATAEGYTHDWTVFVRGPQDCKIHYFIDKIVFVLHESFPKARRVIKEPPYSVSEAGYAGFELPIEIYFKNKEEPKKITFYYDLFLNMDDAVSNIRREKLTFQNPNAEFKKKLLKASGVCHERDNQSSPTPTHQPSQDRPPSRAGSTKSSKSSQPLSTSYKKSKFAIASKDIKTKEGEAQDKPSNQSNNQFADLFGTPIQARPSPDMQYDSSRSTKDKNTKPISSSNSKNNYKTTTQTSSSAPLNEKHKKTKHKNSKERERSSSTDRRKESLKPSKSAIDDRHRYGSGGEIKSYKRSSSPNGFLSSSAPSNERHKKAKHKNSKERERSSSTDRSKDSTKPSKSAIDDRFNLKERDRSSSTDRSKECLKPSKSAIDDRPKNGGGSDIRDSSPNCFVSGSARARSNNNVTDRDSSTDRKLKVKEEKIDDAKSSNDVQFEKTYLKELIELQRKICQLNDRIILQQIVDEIESSASYQLTDTTFEFDLMKLDRATVSKLKRMRL
ncbi:Protein ENL [Halotydeus destructor]|nr:Protein ENL [Halotydeus destructor]